MESHVKRVTQSHGEPGRAMQGHAARRRAAAGREGRAGRSGRAERNRRKEHQKGTAGRNGRNQTLARAGERPEDGSTMVSRIAADVVQNPLS